MLVAATWLVVVVMWLLLLLNSLVWYISRLVVFSENRGEEVSAKNKMFFFKATITPKVF